MAKKSARATARPVKKGAAKKTGKAPGERFTLRLPPAMLADLDLEVTERGFSDRSELVRQIIRRHQEDRAVAKGMGA